jgi:hypothetical protein
VERKKIARAILGEGEFLSEELKDFLRELEVLHGLAAGQPARSIKGRLKSLKEASVEQMREAIKREMRAIEEELLEDPPRSEDMVQRKHKTKNRTNHGSNDQANGTKEPGEKTLEWQEVRPQSNQR